MQLRAGVLATTNLRLRNMSERFAFRDLRELFAKANEEKSGDQLAGLAARSERERVAAKCRLADLSLAEIVQQPLIDPSADDVSRLILQTFDEEAFQPVRSMTVGEFREYILGDATGEAELRQVQSGITPEIAAAVAKIMSNKDLVLAAAKIRNITKCRNTMGQLSGAHYHSTCRTAWRSSRGPSFSIHRRHRNSESKFWSHSRHAAGGTRRGNRTSRAT